MTSEQIQNLCAMVAKNGSELPNGCAEAVSLMHVQFLGEIAYQLAAMNENAECVCGHAVREHHATQNPGERCCNGKQCNCTSLRVSR